jgi:hypothetical protein
MLIQRTGGHFLVIGEGAGSASHTPSPDNNEQRLSKLEAILAQATNDLGEAVPLLAELLSIQTGDRHPPINLTPRSVKRKP